MAVVEQGRTDARVDKSLRDTLKGSNEVVEWSYEMGHDSNGFPAVWVWLVVPDRVASKLGPALVRLAQKVEAKVRSDGRFWPYVYFRSYSEQQALAR